MPNPPPPNDPESPSHDLMDLLRGTVLADRYRLIDRHSESRMGWTFAGNDMQTGDSVTLLVLRPSLCRNAPMVASFRRDALATAQMNSPHIVDVLGFGTTETGSVFQVMEPLGEPLSAVVDAETPLPWPRVLHIVNQLCDTLQAAHDIGIIHRDLRPAHIHRMDADGDPDFIKLLGFGFGRLVQPLSVLDTLVGDVPEPPRFTAPEQAEGEPVDHRTDLYAAGACAYALLTGHAPFEGTDYIAVMEQLVTAKPAPPSHWTPDIPTWLDPIILRCLRHDPNDRFTSLRALAEALATSRPQHPRT